MAALFLAGDMGWRGGGGGWDGRRRGEGGGGTGTVPQRLCTQTFLN